MAEGAISLMSQMYGLHAAGQWRDERGVNVVDGGSHFYNAYQCADGEWVSIAAAEPQFYAELRQKLVLDDPAFDAQMDQSRWPELKAKVAEVINRKTRAQWCEAFEGSDACFAPVMGLAEAPNHPHNQARGAFVDLDGVPQPAPAPRFSKTPGEVQGPPSAPGADNHAALSDWGLEPAEIAALEAAEVI